MKKYKLIYIEWVDTIGDPENGWKDTEGTDDFFDRTDNIVKEVGFIYSEDEDYINLIGSYMPGDIPLTRSRTKIPKKWVLKRKEIRIKI